jgi:hypothetical protein
MALEVLGVEVSLVTVRAGEFAVRVLSRDSGALRGRRGILPSVPGRATPVSNGVNGTAKSTTIPAKDADGKFPSLA